MLMNTIVRDMISHAEKYHDYDVAAFIHRLLFELSTTVDCPSSWRDLAEEIANEHIGDWADENCRLYEFR